MYNKGEISSKTDFSLPPWERGVRQGGMMNLETMQKNVLDFKKIMDDNGISIILIFGTLLGTMRNGQLIPNDSDFDVFCFTSDYLKWGKAKADLICAGFVVPTVHPLHDDFIIRDGEKIDINWIIPFGKFYVYNDDIYYPKEYFDALTVTELFGKQFLVPIKSEQLLIDLYGPNWRIPSSAKGHINIYPK